MGFGLSVLALQRAGLEGKGALMTAVSVRGESRQRKDAQERLRFAAPGPMRPEELHRALKEMLRPRKGCPNSSWQGRAQDKTRSVARWLAAAGRGRAGWDVADADVVLVLGLHIPPGKRERNGYARVVAMVVVAAAGVGAQSKCRGHNANCVVSV